MSLHARILSRTSLFYTDGPDPSLDRPAHVRAGSGLALISTARGRELVVAQDDASFLALVQLHPDGSPGAVSSIPLPAGPAGARQFDDHPGGRGNKQHKLDLESVVVIPDAAVPLVVAFGSGSSSARERLVLACVDGATPEIELVAAPALYAALRAHPLLGGEAELNIEGAALLDSGVLRLFQRGNGRGGVNATFDWKAVDLLAHVRGRGPLPPILDARRWHLGTIDGVRLTFTDATAIGARVFITAAAEASPNAYDDGVVVGCAFGVLGEALHPILDEEGRAFVAKPEGLALVAQADGRVTRGWLVIDSDNPHTPAELLTVAIQDDGTPA